MTVLYPNLCYKKSTLSLPIIYEDQKGLHKITSQSNKVFQRRS